MISHEDYAVLSATEIVRRITDGTLSPVEVTRAALERIEKIDSRFKAFATVDREGAVRAAEQVARKLADGVAPPPLCGVPVAIKDLVLTRGLRTTFGSKLYEDYLPDTDDIVVERLRAAGAIILGKTNCSEFGYGGVGHNPVFPTTRNPWNPDLTSGGSSAGSAVAVATGICPLAIGSDGGGSIRLPAAFNGIFGMKPSMGRVPVWPGCRDPEMPGGSGWETVEHIGPLSRHVDDAALMLSVIAGADQRDRHSIPSDDLNWRSVSVFPKGMRIAYCPDWGHVPTDAEVHEGCLTAARTLARALDADLVVCDADFPITIDDFRTLVAMETDIVGLRAMVCERQVPISGALAQVLETVPGGEEMIRVCMNRKRLANAMADFMRDYDLLLTPSCSCLPFPIDRYGPGTIAGVAVEDDAWTPMAFPFNLTGQPAASVPVGFGASGLPVGLQIVGRHLADADVLNASRILAALLPPAVWV